MSLAESIPLVQSLSPRDKTQKINTYSDLYGVEKFPMHSDFAHWQIPPRFLLLRAPQRSVAVNTSIMPFSEIEKEVGKSRLSKAIFVPRKPVGGKVLPVSIYDNVRDIFRWDQNFIRPVSHSSRNLVESILGIVRSFKTFDFHLQNSGDTLLIDNWKMMHGRGAILPENRNRIIERVYLRKLK